MTLLPPRLDTAALFAPARRLCTLAQDFMDLGHPGRAREALQQACASIEQVMTEDRLTDHLRMLQAAALERGQTAETAGATEAAPEETAPKSVEERLDYIEARLDHMVKNLAGDVRKAALDPRRR